MLYIQSEGYLSASQIPEKQVVFLLLKTHFAFKTGLRFIYLDLVHFPIFHILKTPPTIKPRSHWVCDEHAKS